jgi:hypothetical protein
MHSIAPGQVYSSPIGGVTCQTDPHFKTKVDEVFGPHGGTVHLISELGVTRIDIVEFSPVVPSSILSGSQLNEFHGKYLAESLMPLIRSGVPNASLLGQSVNEVNGRHIHLSAVLLPGKSNFMYPDGKYADPRCQNSCRVT